MFKKIKTRKWRYLVSTPIFLILVLVGSLLISVKQAQAAVTIDTSTNSAATGTLNQRRTFFDNSSNLYWAFYYNGSAIEYSNSSDGITWTSRGTTGVSTDDFSVWYKQSSTSVFMVYTDAGDIKAQKGTLGATSITWTGLTTITSGSKSNASITQDGNGKLWVAYEMNAQPVVSGVSLIQSTNADDTTAWGGASCALATGSTGYDVPQVVPMSTAGNVYTIWHDNDLNDLVGSLYTGSGGCGVTTTIDSNMQSNKLSVVAGSSDQVHVLYKHSGDTKYARYSSSAWGTVVTLATTGNDFQTLTIDTANSDNLYAFWVNANTIYRKKGVSPYASGDWDASATSVISTGTNANLSASYRDGNGQSAFLIWTEGTANPYNVKFSWFGSSPSAPTLSSPGNGSTVISTTPNLQMSSTDADLDTIKYKVLIYNTAAQSGGNCSGTSFETADQNSSGTGWDNGTTAYNSGATATYAVQTAMTRGSTYCWQAQGKDPSGSNTFGSLSTPSTFTINGSPAAPTLITPASSATNISVLPQFSLRTSDADTDYLKYFIQIYDATACGGSQVGSDIDQTASQTGWVGQDMQSATAYSGAFSVSNSSVALYQYSGTALTANHLYSWRAKAIDPGGANSFSSLSSCQDFTTGTSEVQIQGGVELRGGTTVQ